MPVICEKPLPILNGLVEGKSYNYGDIISYTCLPGFELQVHYFLLIHFSKVLSYVRLLEQLTVSRQGNTLNKWPLDLVVKTNEFSGNKVHIIL